jgi:hypothetical protein
VVVAKLREADKQPLGIVAAFIMYLEDIGAVFDCRVGYCGGVRLEAA